MASIEQLRSKYDAIEEKFDVLHESEINTDCLLVFDYEYKGSNTDIVIETEEFSAVCPWNGLPDFGLLTLEYVPESLCVELKSLKYYLMSFRSVGIVQEHAANRILKDLVGVCNPVNMKVTLDYQPRGGFHTVVIVSHPSS